MIVFDFAGYGRRVFQEPRAVFAATDVGSVTAVLQDAERAARAGGWVAGYVSYEAAPAFDPGLAVRGGARLPLAWFAVFDSFKADAPVMAESAGVEWSRPDEAAYVAAVEAVREEIAAGRTYQLNLTTALEATCPPDLFAWYEALRRAQGSGYHAYIETPGFTILSVSPELFFEKRGSRIVTRPMKGTRPRGRFTEEDDDVQRELARSDKDRAENLMIVDLLRNDLGRVAQIGTVRVSALYDIERYRTVHQMTSRIEAAVSDEIGLVDIFGALFPCGSVTGAPKRSTMELITTLESTTREVYCGAIGIIEPGGAATFNVPIRTVWCDRDSGRAVYGTGAGITYESDAGAEYREIVAKAAVLTETWPPFELLETMRLDSDLILRVDRHLARLADSARYFGIPIDLAAVRELLAGVRGSGRLRLLVDQLGTPRAELQPLREMDAVDFALAGSPVDSQDRFLFHKTTHRSVYAQHERPDREVLLWNERGELTEFTRANVVLDIAGELLTPPRTAGLLAGVLRAELIETGVVREQLLHVEDVGKANGVWFVNSLRGRLPARQAG